MKKTFEELLGEDLSQFIHLVGRVLSEVENHKYYFMGEDEFGSLLKSSPKDAQAQYMKELLFRANFNSLSAIARNYEWLIGMRSSYESGLYLPFASSFRCLIESVADSYFSLANLSVNISKNFKVINDSVNKRSDKFYVIKDLENQLIHYSHARKISGGENVPDSHKAETAAKYVKELDDKTNSNFYNCYSELCQLSHPAAQGVLHMMLPIDEHNFVFEHKFGKEKIANTIENYRDDLIKLVTFAFNPSFLSLKVMNCIDFDLIYVDSVNAVNMEHIEAWKKRKQEIVESCM